MNKTRHQIPGYPDSYYYDEFFIKKRKGKQRRVCAPSPDLKSVQRSMMDEFYRAFRILARSNGVYDAFHGFLPNRNIVTAASKHIGYKTTIQMDISNCFDSIQLSSLGITNPLLKHHDGSLAQGFVTSPILANMYLIRVLKDITRALQTAGIQVVITSYADDLAISTNETDYNIINIIPQIVTEIMQNHNLSINKGKTRIRHSKYGNRKILGIMVGNESLLPSRKLKGKIRAARHVSNGPSLGGLITASRMLIPRSLR